MVRAMIFDCFGVLAEDGWLPFKRKYIGDNTLLAEQVADLGKQNEYGFITNDEMTEKVAECIGVERSLLENALGKRLPNEELFEYIRTNIKPRDFKVALMSNANYDVLTQLFGPDQSAVFDTSVLSYECKLIKPDKAMFQLVCDRLAVPAGDCVFIDDVDRYCVAAEEYGMKSVKYENLESCIASLENILNQS